MNQYLNKSGNSPVTNYQIGSDYIIVRFKGNKDYKYSYNGKAGKEKVDIMKSLAISGSGLSAFITKNAKMDYD